MGSRLDGTPLRHHLLGRSSHIRMALCAPACWRQDFDSVLSHMANEIKTNKEAKHLNGALCGTCWMPGAMCAAGSRRPIKEYVNDSGGVGTPGSAI